MSTKYYEVIVAFLTYGWFGAIRNSNSRRMVYNYYIFIDRNILSYKIRTQKSQTQPLNYGFVEMYYFYEIMLTLCKKNNDISAKLKWISQDIWQAVHTNFADYAIILVWKTWSSALNHLNC